MIRAGLAGVAVCISLVGCTSTRLYPVCFYSRKPDAATVADTMPRLVNVIAAELGSWYARTPVATADARWVVVRATTRENERIAKFWPRTACIGSTESDAQVLLENYCVDYARDFILTGNYLAMGRYKGVGASGAGLVNESPDPMRLVNCYGADAP